MLKAQSLVIQFVIFFIIGLTSFIGIAQFFSFESSIFQNEASVESMNLINSYFSSLMLTAYDNCKQCDAVIIGVKTQNTTVGSYFEVSLGTYGLNASIPYSKINSTTSYHNINYSVSGSGFVISSRLITVTFNRTKNQLKLS
jgi:hypothetical protein